jgi:voltage-gated potassium channel
MPLSRFTTHRPLSEGARRMQDRVRSPEDLQKLSDFEHRIYFPLVLSALLPIVSAASRSGQDSGVSIAVNVVSWLVFVLDLVVHMHYVRRYLRTGVGRFDLVVVILTAPWFLIPGLGGSQILVLTRLARLVRLVLVTPGARRAAARIGRVGVFAIGMLLFCSWMAYVAEHHTNSEFATFGDALWWGIVTLTTVGYGDIVPDTQKGRVAGTLLMLTGIATLGLISGTLASAFRRPTGDDAATAATGSATGAEQGTVNTPDTVGTGDTAGDPAGATAELTAIRAQLDALERHLAELTTGAGGRDAPQAGPG